MPCLRAEFLPAHLHLEAIDYLVADSLSIAFTFVRPLYSNSSPLHSPLDLHSYDTALQLLELPQQRHATGDARLPVDQQGRTGCSQRHGRQQGSG